jgi:anti-sigma B factor antagonist
MPPGLTVHSECTGDTSAVVAVAGELDVSTASSLRTELDRLLARSVTTLTLDITDLGFIDSTGLGTIVGALKRARSAGGDVSLRRPAPPIRRVLDLTALTPIIEILD